MPICFSTNKVEICAELAALEQTNILTTVSFIRPIRAVWFIVTDKVGCNALFVVAQKVSGFWANFRSLSHWGKKQRCYFTMVSLHLITHFNHFIYFTLLNNLVILIVAQGRCPHNFPSFSPTSIVQQVT